MRAFDGWNALEHVEAARSPVLQASRSTALANVFSATGDRKERVPARTCHARQSVRLLAGRVPPQVASSID